MTPQQQSEMQVFVDKSERLSELHRRFKIKENFLIKWCDKHFYDVFDELDDSQRELLRKTIDKFPWNYFRDQMYEIEQEAQRNWRAYHDWHWDNFQFNAY